MASGLCAALTGRTHGCTDQPTGVVFGSAPSGFRTIQVCAKDLAALLQQVEPAVDQLPAPRREEARCPT
jgi:hypothetical protein